MPPRGMYVDCQLTEVILAEDKQSASFPLVFTGWVSTKRHLFSVPGSVIEASILTPESVAKAAKSGAFTRGTQKIPMPGIFGLAAKLASGGISAALNSNDGTAGLEVAYSNDKNSKGTFRLVGDADLITVLLSMIPPALVAEQPI